jgi:hypothetical protein
MFVVETYAAVRRFVFLDGLDAYVQNASEAKCHTETDGPLVDFDFRSHGAAPEGPLDVGTEQQPPDIEVQGQLICKMDVHTSAQQRENAVAVINPLTVTNEDGVAYSNPNIRRQPGLRERMQVCAQHRRDDANVSKGHVATRQSDRANEGLDHRASASDARLVKRTGHAELQREKGV